MAGEGTDSRGGREMTTAPVPVIEKILPYLPHIRAEASAALDTSPHGLKR